MKRPVTNSLGLRMCKQCKAHKSADHFLAARKRGHDNVFCNECARENMSKWARTPLSKMTPDQIKELAD